MLTRPRVAVISILFGPVHSSSRCASLWPFLHTTHSSFPPLSESALIAAMASPASFLPEAFLEFQQARVQDLTVAWSLLQTAVETRQLPTAEQLPTSVLATSLSALLLLNILLFSRIRFVVFETLNTIIATALLLLLIVLLLGFPIGASSLLLRLPCFHPSCFAAPCHLRSLLAGAERLRSIAHGPSLTQFSLRPSAPQLACTSVTRALPGWR